MVEFNAADLLVPDGKLDVGWFAGKTPEQVVALLSGFADDVSDAVAVLEGDDVKQYAALEAWTYGQGFLFIATDLANRTGTTTIPNEITRQITKDGPDFFERRSQYWLGLFYTIIPAAVPPSVRRPTSMWVSASFRF
jgi:hypothetical protein